MSNLNVEDVGNEFNEKLRLGMRVLKTALEILPTNCREDLLLLGALLGEAYVHATEEHNVAIDKPMKLVINDITITMQPFDLDLEAQKTLDSLEGELH